jgi:hypothetical protein
MTCKKVTKYFLDFLEIKEREGESKLVLGTSLGYGVLLW